jgi:hypothetical protein
MDGAKVTNREISPMRRIIPRNQGGRVFIVDGVAENGSKSG